MDFGEVVAFLAITFFVFVFGLVVGSCAVDETVTSEQWYACEEACRGGTQVVNDVSSEIICTCEDGATYTLTDDEVTNRLCLE